MIKMFATDLDGTLKVIKEEHRVAEKELIQWEKLGEQNKTRVLATGRNLKLISKTLRDDAPFDYIVFSSGAGVIDWRNKEILKRCTFKFKEIKKLCKYLLKIEIPFFLFHDIPENHKSYISPSLHNQKNEFFGQKIFYKKHSNLIPNINTINPEENFTQLLITTDINEISKLKELNKKIDSFGKFSWIDVMSIFQEGSRMVEIFPEGINKGNALKYIFNKENIHPSETVVFGNDFNDLEMLQLSSNSFITKGSPNELEEFASVIGSVKDCTVATKIESIIESNFKL